MSMKKEDLDLPVLHSRDSENEAPEFGGQHVSI
jgi:hypothetical protein